MKRTEYRITRSLAIEWDDGHCEILHTMNPENVPRHDGRTILVEKIGTGWFEVETN